MPTLQTYNTMDAIERLMEFAHFDQRDRAGYPYAAHPRRVMDTVRQQGGAPYVQMAAALHDITEDTRFTPQMLLDLGVPEAAVEIIKLLDRDYSRSLFVQNTPDILDMQRADVKDAIDAFYYANIKNNSEARMVKLADITDNTQPWRMSYMKEETQQRLKAKYAKAHQLLGVV